MKGIQENLERVQFKDLKPLELPPLHLRIVLIWGLLALMGGVMLSFADGDHPSSVRTHCALPAGATRQRQPVEPASAQRHPVRRRAWLQVAGAADPVRQLAHHLHPDEPLVQERGARPGLRAAPTGTDRAHPARGGVAGQRHRQGPSRRNGCATKNGPDLLAVARTGPSRAQEAGAESAGLLRN